MVRTFCLLVVLVLAGSAPIQAADPVLSVIPRPVKLAAGNGEFTLTPETLIVVAKDARGEGEYLANYLAPATGFKLAVREASGLKAQAGSIVLRIVADRDDLGDEGYVLRVERDRILVEARAAAGVFYGIQTIRQLLPAEAESKEKVTGVKWTIPVVTVEDKSRFSWRGLMLDTGRVYHPMPWLKQYLDLMALHKLNRFHWHLTERVGWRIEIKKYPQLIKYYLPKDDPKNRSAGQFYSQDDIREILAYAKARHIMVIPEIEMPGHSGACITAYPDKMQCVKDGPWSRRSSLLHNRIMFSGNDGTFEVLEGVLSEVADLFPAPWIHCGGDEPHVRVWGECKRCQARMKAEKIQGPHGLYNYFMKRVEKIVLKKGKRMYGWEEIGRAGLSKSATIQSWHGIGPGVASAKAGLDVVMSPSSHCYLDGGTPITTCYSFDPMPKGLSADEARHILGVEAPMWMDKWRRFQYQPVDKGRLDRQVFPRLLALAEVGWSPQALRQWEDFSKRLAVHRARMIRLGINY